MDLTQASRDPHATVKAARVVCYNVAEGEE
jgi:hypothetical protein